MKGTDDCIHLSLEVVKEIHTQSIKRFGGTDGVRSTDLLESALAAPQAGFGGKSTFADLIEVAAAYLFYLCSNHPFLDGNKRTALGACLVFLKINGARPAADSEDWESLTMGVASGELSREQATNQLRDLVEPT
tara:strand:+ start:2822 stop:3223 length:402 start_codon:yes stop_codon:yes gene_type:complete